MIYVFGAILFILVVYQAYQYGRDVERCCDRKYTDIYNAGFDYGRRYEQTVQRWREVKGK